MDQCYITQVKVSTAKKPGREMVALQVGASLLHPKNCPKTVAKHLEKAGLPPLRKFAEFQVTKDAVLPAGLRLDVRHFAPGQPIDVVGTSKGHGFTGAMKRWNFRGQPATHGASISHRSIGATGSRQDPGRVFKGKRMAGRWGGTRVTIKNVIVEKIDVLNELLFLHGCIPGVTGSYVLLRDAVSDQTEKLKAPFPTYVHKRGDLKVRWLYRKSNKTDPFGVPTNVVAQ